MNVKITDCHLKLAKSIASKFRPIPGMDREDLISCAYAGLAKAAIQYDQSHGTKFETYAYNMIKWEVVEGIRVSGWISRAASKLPEGHPQRQLPTSLDEMGHNPFKPISEGSGVARVDLLIGSHNTELEAFARMGICDEPQTFEEIIQPCHFPERYLRILKQYYQEGLTLQEISKLEGTKPSRISQIHCQCLSRLRVVTMSKSA